MNHNATGSNNVLQVYNVQGDTARPQATCPVGTPQICCATDNTTNPIKAWKNLMIPTVAPVSCYVPSYAAASQNFILGVRHVNHLMQCCSTSVPRRTRDLPGDC